jgi:hypothetical protein
MTKPAMTPAAFTLLGIYAFPATVLLLPYWAHDRSVRRLAIVGLLVGLLAGVLLESAVGKEHGRIGGVLWTAAGLSPTVLGRSSLIVVGSAFGGATAGILFGLLVAAGRARTAWLLAAFAVSFLAAYTVNSFAFQRYFDPPLLLALGWCLASLEFRETSGGRIGRGQLRLAAAGVCSMQVVFSGISIYLMLGWAPD